MSNYSELVQIIKELLNNRFLPQRPVARGLLGDGLGNVIVPGRPDFNYVRFNRASSERFEVFNKRVSQPVDGTPVLIGEDYLQPGLIQVLSIDWSTYLQTDWGDAYASIQAHAPTHEWPTFAPGSDPVNVYPRSFTQLRTQSVGSGSNSVYVTPYEYDWTGTSTIWPGVPPVSFSAKPPTGSMLYMGVYLNPATNTLGVVSGSTTTYTDAVEPPIPNWPLGVFPSGYVRLYGGQAGITERDIRPAQRLYNSTLVYTGTSVGGGGSPSGPAGGDLTGTYPDPRVVGLNSIPILGTPAVNQFLMFTGSAWRPSTFTIPDQWPYDKILTVSPTDAGADFATIQDAIDYQELNTLQDVIILCDPAVYTETLTFTLGSVCLASLGVNGEVVITSTDAITITINAANVTLRNITIDNDETGTNGIPVQVAANRDGTIFDNVRFNITNATVDNAICADINGGDTLGTLFRECTFYTDAGSVTNTAIDVATDCIILVEDGQIEALGATNYAINSASGSIIQLNGPRFISGSINGLGSIISDRTLDVTINGPVTANNSLNGKNPGEATISTTVNTTDTTLTVNAASLTFANWTIQNDGAGGAGITHTVVANAQTGLIMDGCSIVKTTGASTTARGFVSTGGDALLRNCKFNVTAGSTVNYVIYLVTAGSTVIIEGGEITAGTIVTAHASAVLELRGVKLASGVTFDTSGGGIIKGWYLDSRNKIISLGGTHTVMPTLPNGDFLVWQRGTSFAAIADGTYVADNWRYNKVGAMVHTVSQDTDVPTVAAAGRKINYSLLADCTTVDSSIAAGDFALLRTCLEGYDWIDYAQVGFPFSFWVKATKTGTYCVSFRNSGLDRSYVAEYTVSVTDTWEFKTAWVEPSPTAGTWDYTNGIGVIVTFALACGSTFHTTAGAWQTGDFRATANQVNACDNTANNFRLALVGSVPDDSFKAKLERCQRYFWKSFAYATAPAQSAGTTNVLRWAAITAGATAQRSPTFLLPTVLRTSSPTITFYNPSAANAQVRDANAGGDCTATATGSVGDSGFNINCTGNAGTAANNSLLIHATAAADM